MSDAPVEPGGLALLCDADGTVLDVLTNELGVTGAPLIGARFERVVDPSAAEKARRFLGVLRAQRAAFGWELNLPLATGRTLAAHFAAGAAGEGFLIVAAASRGRAARLYQELSGAIPGRQQAAGPPAGDFARLAQEHAERDDRQYDELSRLNNELANAQRELARKNAELARLNEQKNQFLGMAAHDLRNPLQVVLTYSEFLLEGAADRLEGEEARLAEAIRDSTAYMLRIVDDFLDVAKIEAGRLALERGAADLGAILRRNAERNGALAARHGVTVRAVTPARPALLEIDALKVEQVLDNLVGNAVKFSPDGGTVTVSLACDDGGAVVEVRDEGPGVAPSELEALFAPFVTGGDPRRTGAGLGLAIAKRIVEGHGGRLWAESAPGGGTSFFFSLPARTRGAGGTA